MERRTLAVLAVVLGAALFAGVGAPIVAERVDLLAGEGRSDRAEQESSRAFAAVANDSGFEFVSGDAYREATDEVTNAGVYAADYDGDNWTDLLAVSGNSVVLFENTGGAFERSGALPAVDRRVQSALFFDQDGDGDEDLLLLASHRAPLFLENTGGAFRRADVGLDDELGIPTGATAADYDGDGCPDLFVIQMGNWSRSPPAAIPDFAAGPGSDNGARNLLYEGDCEGFRNVTGRAGIAGEHWSLATSFADLDGDGRPDIHVANDFHRDTIYRNEGNGSFDRRKLGEFVTREGKRVLGPHTNRNAMASEIADVDGDGHLDIYVTNIHYPPEVAAKITGDRNLSRGHNLFLGDGSGGFEAVTDDSAVREGGWGWATAAGDFDNDGDLDLFHATSWIDLEGAAGMFFSSDEIRTIRRQNPSLQYPRLIEHDGGDYQQRDPRYAGFAKSDGRGVAQLDFDRDGDLDLAVADASGPYRLYENRGEAGAALQVTLRGEGEQSPMGATVLVDTGEGSQTRVVNTKTDFLSQDSRVVHVGTGTATTVDVTVVWADGSEQSFADVRTGRRLVVTPDGIEATIPFED